MAASAQETAFSGGSFSETAPSTGENKGCLNFWGVGRGFQGEYTSLARAKVLGMPYLYEEGFQGLAGHDLIRRGEV